MATSQVVLLLDSGALIAAGKNQRVEAIIRRWRAEGAQFVIAAPSIAESTRGGPKDAQTNALIKAIGRIEPTTEKIARNAGVMLAKANSGKTIHAIIVATAFDCHASDILTSDPDDIRSFAGGEITVHRL